MPGDYDGDGKADVAVFRPAEGSWYILKSTTGIAEVIQWGNIGDKLVPGDYDGDGKTDCAVFRSTEGNWYVKKSSGGGMVQGWGNSTDVVVPADYDGDGKFDFAVYRPAEGNWYILKSSTNTSVLQNIGNDNYISVPSAYIRSVTVSPSYLNATPAADAPRVTLSWSDNMNSSAGFIIERKESAGAKYDYFVAVGEGLTTFTDENVVPNKTYTYRALAVNSNGWSLPSNEVNATTSSNGSQSPSASPTPITINFDSYPSTTRITTQYSSKFVNFSSDQFFFPPAIHNNCGYCVFKSPPNDIDAGPWSAYGYSEVFLQFTQPMKDFSFWVNSVSSIGPIYAKVDIWENGSYARTISIYNGGYNTYYPIFYSFSTYGSKITRVRFHSVTDYGGIGYDDISYTPNPNPSPTPTPTPTPQVSSVAFQPLDSPLDNNPHVGGGLRIFPDKQSPTDTVNRKRVRVVATMPAGAAAGTAVYFRGFDVDDPSDDLSPVDSNGGAGGDNRGTPNAGSLSRLTATTDANGVATADFTTTMQPGDNFMIAASTDQAYLNGLTVDGIGLRDSTGAALPTMKAKATPLLTVWRNLHIEVDSMGYVAGNSESGIVTSIVTIEPYPEAPCPNCNDTQYAVCVNRTLEINRFEKGRLVLGAVSYHVENNDADCIGLGTQRPATQVGAPFVVYDDDDFNDNDGALLDGDDGEKIPRPDTSLLQVSDNPSLNVFAPAYVRPKYDVGDNNDFVPLALNLNGFNFTYPSTYYDFDSVGTETDADFWTVYLLGCYQESAADDNDPETDGQTTGIVDFIPDRDHISGQGALVFSELLRATEITPNNSKATVAAHEVGHLFNGLHEDSGLMKQGIIIDPRFTVVTLNKIRKLTYP